MSIPEVFAVVSACLNVLVLLTAAYIKADVSAMKVYMHEKFITKHEFNEMMALNHEKNYRPY